MITVIEYWNERVRDQILGMVRSGDLPAEVHDQLKASGAAIDRIIEEVIEYPEGADDRRNNGMAVTAAIAQVRSLEAFLRSSLKSDILWFPAAKQMGNGLGMELVRLMNCFLHPNWFPTSTTVRYAEPAHTHAEVVGCAPFFREELFYEGMEYDANMNVPEGAPRHQIQISICGYLDGTSLPPDLIVTEIIAFSQVGTGKCQAVESIVNSERIVGMTPRNAWYREALKLQRRSKKIILGKIQEARAYLMMDREVVH
jgi:hypothetical protein